MANALLADGALAASRPRPALLTSTREGGDLPDILTYSDDRAEALAVARLLRAHAFDGRGWRPDAVLYRTNAKSAVFEAALSSAGIPYRIRGDRAFVTRPEIRRVLDAVHRQPSAPAAATVGAAVAKAEAAASLDDDARANLSVLRDLAQELEEIQPGATVAAFSEWLVRTASGDESHGGAAVELVTMHRAKGLEWDVVVVAGCEAGLLPIGMARGGDEIDEERRLFYVGVTHARERFVLARA